MSKAQVLPSLLIAINIASAVIYAMDADLRHALYWASAAVLTATVTF